MATPVIASASRGCCPCCREMTPINEDGWRSCPDCSVDFQVETDLEGYTRLIMRQPADFVTDLKARIMVGFLGLRPDQNSGRQL